LAVVKAKPIKVKGKSQFINICPQCGEMPVDAQGIPLSKIEVFQKRRNFCMAQVPGCEMDRDGRRKKDEGGCPTHSGQITLRQ